MAERRITIYQRNTGRPIVLTDKLNVQQSISDFKNQLIEVMSGENEFIKFQTIDDFLIIRTDEIGGIMLSAEGEFKEVIPTPTELAKLITTDKKKTIPKPEPKIEPSIENKPKITEESDYEQILVIEESVENKE